MSVENDAVRYGIGQLTASDSVDLEQAVQDGNSQTGLQESGGG